MRATIPIGSYRCRSQFPVRIFENMPRPSRARTRHVPREDVPVVLVAAATHRTLSYSTTDAGAGARGHALTHPVAATAADSYALIAGFGYGRMRHAGQSESQSTEAGQAKNRPCKAHYILVHSHRLSPWLIVAFFRARQTLKCWICHARNFFLSTRRLCGESD